MRRILFISILSVFLAGCITSMPIQNIETSPVPAIVSATQSEVGNAIRMAITKKGWKVTADKSGYIEATLRVRNKHTAVVGIPYTDRTYNIEYVSSSNLNHRGNMIHRNYNKWVLLLDRQIQLELTKI